MKTKNLIFLFFISFIVACCGDKVITEDNKTTIKKKGRNHTAIFKVWGNCEMCKQTIEEALKKDGILKADWDVDTKIMEVSFDSTKINLEDIQKNIALAGYDNVMFKGDDNAYKKLPECCQYERKK